MRINETAELFESATYPTTASDLAAEFEDKSVTLPNGTETVGTVLERLGESTFESASEAHLAFMSALSRRAIGRVAYADRDPASSGISERDPRAVEPLLESAWRFSAGGPHCGMCEHVQAVGDWDAWAYCSVREELIDPLEIDSVCEDYAEMAR